jgi:DNA/RNA endonuclease G (NUC1)
MAYSEDRWRIGYGETGFEPFTIDVPDALRGKVATLKFVLDGGGEVYIDNVFFKSQHLSLGNPTEARQPDNVGTVNDPIRKPYDTNYLLEKSQYAVSYNDQTKTPNWASWQLNKSWIIGDGKRASSFQQDPQLPSEWYGVSTRDFAGGRAQFTDERGLPKTLAQGHFTAAEDRSRNDKDIISTFFGTNVIPQHPSNNSGLWRELERFSQRLAVEKDKELYIMTGGFGTYSQKTGIQTVDGNYTINVPETLWKVIVILDQPGQSLVDLARSGTTSNINDRVIAIKVPNNNTSGGSASPVWWDSKYQVSVRNLEAELLQATGVRYDFLSALPQDIQDRYELSVYSGAVEVNGFSKTMPAAPLMANSWTALPETSFELSTISNATVWHNSITEDSLIQDLRLSRISIRENTASQISTKEVGLPQVPSIGQVSIGQIGTREVNFSQSSFIQDASSQVGFTQIGLGKINLAQVSSSQVSSSQVALSNTSSGQISIAKIDESHILMSKLGVPENSVLQIQTSQLIGVPQVSSTEIPLSSGITFQQFLTSHNLNLQNTTIPTWTEFLTGTTPFNLNIEITDLPTGQLAEANITSFDSTGRPTSGTLTLDTDANGLGWF